MLKVIYEVQLQKEKKKIVAYKHINHYSKTFNRSWIVRAMIEQEVKTACNLE